MRVYIHIHMSQLESNMFHDINGSRCGLRTKLGCVPTHAHIRTHSASALSCSALVRIPFRWSKKSISQHFFSDWRGQCGKKRWKWKRRASACANLQITPTPMCANGFELSELDAVRNWFLCTRRRTCKSLRRLETRLRHMDTVRDKWKRNRRTSAYANLTSLAQAVLSAMRPVCASGNGFLQPIVFVWDGHMVVRPKVFWRLETTWDALRPCWDSPEASFDSYFTMTSCTLRLHPTDNHYNTIKGVD